MRLQDKVILVTASTRGIGLAIVKKCAQEGAKVYMAARDPDRAQEIASALNGVKCVYNDATKPETFSSMVEDVIADAGRIEDYETDALAEVFDIIERASQPKTDFKEE
jgi:NAD(P)-dependent dehydrogenase (short-subunit alcohol dehydrogenase family)